MTTRRIPPNLFGIPFGLAGLATAWQYAARHDLAPAAIADTLLVAGALAWLAVLAAYLAPIVAHPRLLREDLEHPVLAPFVALALIAPLVLVVGGVVPHAPGLGKVLVDVLVALIVALGSWFTGQWIFGELRYDQLHPGYFLPNVAGGLLGAVGAAAVGQERLAYALLGLGVVSWLIIGSMVLARLFFGPPLPPALYPTLAIEVAPAAVATQAWLAVRGDAIDPVVAVLGGYGLMMVLAQVRLLPAYRRLSFVPAFWSFTFSWAGVAVAALHWLVLTRPAGWETFAYLVLAAITVLVAAIAARTLAALAGDTFVPQTAAPVRR